MSKPSNEHNNQHIPLVFNTIENCYRNICVVGRDSRARALYLYLNDNKNVSVVWVQEDHDGIIVDDDIEIVIFMFDFAVPAQNCKNEVYSVSYERLVNNDVDNPFFDIYKNIIPRLIQNGIRVFVVTTPDLRKYRPKLPLYISLSYFRFLNKHSRKRDKLYMRHLNQDGIYSEFIKTKADKSKGYLRVYGNGNRINYDDGFRRVPCEYSIKNTISHIYLFGFCMSANPMLPDDCTIAAILQSQAKDRYRVVSRGNDGASINIVMRNISYSNHDVVVLFTSHHDKEAFRSGAKIVELTQTYCEVKALWKHLADGSFHCDANITDCVAKRIWDSVNQAGDLKIPISHNIVEFGSHNKRCPSVGMLTRDIQDYIKNIKNSAKRVVGGYSGAIVMNCNPFTLGHQYLIEQASKMVDVLYIFVVEEDKSIFKFADRFDMVKEGIKKIENVNVFPSGKHIISATTLPGYFDKKHLGNIEVSASEDMELFAVIASELDIKVRFAGTEPKDRYTNSYNSAMKKLLPLYGIEFVEIPRIETAVSNDVISATYVRNMIEKNENDIVRKLVPASTYNILENRGYLYLTGE